MFVNSTLFRICRPLLLALFLVVGPPTVARAAIINVDFDGVNASGTSVTGTALDSYLTGFGITISNVMPFGYPEVHNTNDNGALSGFPANFLTASSPPNFLSHGDGITGGGANAPTNNPISYQLNFSTLLNRAVPF